MLKECVFGALAILANVLLFNLLATFIPFLSSQDLTENKTDASTLSLFTVDVGLVLLFMAQHSLLATKTFRLVFDDLGWQPVSRSVYILATVGMLQVLMSYWQPITEVRFWLLDTADRPLLWLFFHLLHWMLWCVLILQVLVIQPLYMVGLKQVYYYIRGWHNPSYYLHPRLRQLIYHMPHAGSGCFVAILWVHPCMTYDRMILATVFTAYLCCRYAVTEKDYTFVKKFSETKYEKRMSWKKVA